jgi:hypothetical protein
MTPPQNSRNRLHYAIIGRLVGPQRAQEFCNPTDAATACGITGATSTANGIHIPSLASSS